MKAFFSILFFSSISFLSAQPNTEVYAMDLNASDGKFEISTFQNISNNEGYDNQPFFQNNSEILFSKSRNNQTDISLFNIQNKKSEWLSNTAGASEYSPQVLRENSKIFSVQLDTAGVQRLYNYEPSKNPEIAIEKLQVAYYALYNENELLATVLDGNDMDLVTINLQEKRVDTLLSKAGRSLHKVPNSEMMSYTLLNEEGNYDIYQFDMKTKESFFVAQLPIGIQDHVWLDDARLLIGSGYLLFMYDLFGDGDWDQVANLSDYNINDITRLAVSPDGKKLALVALPKKD